MSNSSIATLVGSDNIEVQATYQAAKQSLTIGTMFELLDEQYTNDLPIPVPGVAGDVLAKVMEWCERHREDPVPKLDDKETTKPCKIIDIPAWDQDFFKIDKDMIIGVTNAADYLEIPLLLQYAVCIIADRLKGMDTEQMRQFLNIENDFSPEEEQKIRADNAWVLEEEP
ncbi:S-phase kinase-associated protein 1A [Xylaria telfairii]|nr:S-phase kinase-associated protein 1A [Xylaria telfairii]